VCIHACVRPSLLSCSYGPIDDDGPSSIKSPKKTIPQLTHPPTPTPTPPTHPPKPNNNTKGAAVAHKFKQGYAYGLDPAMSERFAKEIEQELGYPVKARVQDVAVWMDGCLDGLVDGWMSGWMCTNTRQYTCSLKLDHPNPHPANNATTQPNNTKPLYTHTHTHPPTHTHTHTHTHTRCAPRPRSACGPPTCSSRRRPAPSRCCSSTGSSPTPPSSPRVRDLCVYVWIVCTSVYVCMWVCVGSDDYVLITDRLPSPIVVSSTTTCVPDPSVSSTQTNQQTTHNLNTGSDQPSKNEIPPEVQVRALLRPHQFPFLYGCTIQDAAAAVGAPHALSATTRPRPHSKHPPYNNHHQTQPPPPTTTTTNNNNNNY
jgi:hypothetical protein